MAADCKEVCHHAWKANKKKESSSSRRFDLRDAICFAALQQESFLLMPPFLEKRWRLLGLQHQQHHKSSSGIPESIVSVLSPYYTALSSCSIIGEASSRDSWKDWASFKEHYVALCSTYKLSSHHHSSQNWYMP